MLNYKIKIIKKIIKMINHEIIKIYYATLEKNIIFIIYLPRGIVIRW